MTRPAERPVVTTTLMPSSMLSQINNPTRIDMLELLEISGATLVLLTTLKSARVRLILAGPTQSLAEASPFTLVPIKARPSNHQVILALVSHVATSLASECQRS